ncbi:unnamed protein product [Diamesa hyperborea]
MATIKYIGRTTDFCGKSLWEIVGNLKNFGIGRVVKRHMFERYQEPSYLRILKVEAVPHEENRKVKVTVEKVFRGRKYPKPVEIYSASYKTDYRLLSKSEESDYCKIVDCKEKIIPQTMDFPPLLKHFLMQETGKTEAELKLKVVHKEGRDKISRLAKDGETPNINLSINVGKPSSANLYEGSL